MKEHEYQNVSVFELSPFCIKWQQRLNYMNFTHVCKKLLSKLKTVTYYEMLDQHLILK